MYRDGRRSEHTHCYTHSTLNAPAWRHEPAPAAAHVRGILSVDEKRARDNNEGSDKLVHRDGIVDGAGETSTREPASFSASCDIDGKDSVILSSLRVQRLEARSHDHSTRPLTHDCSRSCTTARPSRAAERARAPPINADGGRRRPKPRDGMRAAEIRRDRNRDRASGLSRARPLGIGLALGLSASEPIQGKRPLYPARFFPSPPAPSPPSAAPTGFYNLCLLSSALCFFMPCIPYSLCLLPSPLSASRSRCWFSGLLRGEPRRNLQPWNR